MSAPAKPPKALDAIVDKVLRYRPPARTKQAKRRKRRARRVRQNP